MLTKELREKRANLVAQAGTLLKTAKEEERELTAQESEQFDNLHTEADKLKSQIDRSERQEAADAEMRESRNTRVGLQEAGDDEDRSQTPSETPEARNENELRALRSWLGHGMNGLTAEQRQIMASRFSNLPSEARAQGVSLDSGGGYTVPDVVNRRIESAMAAYAGIRNTRATIIRTDNGADMPWPTSDDTSNSGELLGENTQAGAQDVTFGAKTLRSYMFTSKIVRASLQFLQDTSIANPENWLADRLGERIGRATGSYFITGTDDNQPEGLETGATLGKTAAAVAAITYEELVDLFHSVDPSYRTNAEFLLGDGALKLLKKLTDGNGNPQWVPGIAVREPDTIMGKPYVIDTNISDPAASVKSIFFGDFSKFLIRDVTGRQLLRLTERYADYLQVGFLLFSRHDSMVLDAGTNPIKYLAQAAG